MPPKPERLAESVVRQLDTASERHAGTWVRHFGMKCERSFPGQAPPSGFDAAIRHECWRAMMYGAIAMAGEQLKDRYGAPEIALVRQKLQGLLFASPPETGGDAAQTKVRVAAYHAAWKGGGPAAAYAVLRAALAEAAGVKGTPFESAADAMSQMNAQGWLSYGAQVYRLVLE